jgi:AcrR family transcriptional regulator
MSLSKKAENRSDRRRALIISAALDVFLEFGFERASLDEIIKRSGGSKSTIYAQFGGKDALFFAILNDAAKNITLKASTISPRNSEEVRLLLVSVAEGIVGSVLREEIIGLYKLAVEASRLHPAVGQLYFKGGPEKAQGDFAKLLKQLTSEKHLQVPDADLAAQYFFGMLLDKAHLKMSLGVARPPSRKETARLIQGAVAVFLAAYGRSEF